MKVLMINSGSKENGNTGTALKWIKKTLEEHNVETETIFLGTYPIADCIGCNECFHNSKCIYDDVVNEITIKAKNTDGFVFAAPVYYVHPSSRLLSVLDRSFYSNANVFKHKPAMSIVSLRNAGQFIANDIINNFMIINEMPIIISTYWNENDSEKEVYDNDSVNRMRNAAIRLMEAVKNRHISI